MSPVTRGGQTIFTDDLIVNANGDIALRSSSPMQSFRRLISSGCLLISAITLLQALFGLTSSHVLLHDKVKRHGEDAAVRKVTELRTENRRLRLLLDNERLRSAMQDHLGQPPPTTANQEATKTTQRSEGCCEGPAVAESAATGQAHVDCMVAPDEQRRRLLSYLDAVMCVTSVCLAATRSRRGLPTASHMVSGRPFVVLTHVLPGEEALLVPFAAATAALRLPTVALVAHMEEAEAAAANISAQLVDEAELAAMRLKLAPGAERMTLSRLVLWTAIEVLRYAHTRAAHLGTARARLLRLLGARLAALGSSPLPKGKRGGEAVPLGHWAMGAYPTSPSPQALCFGRARAGATTERRGGAVRRATRHAPLAPSRQPARGQ